MLWLKLLFWFSAATLFYAYVGFPAVIRLLAGLRPPRPSTATLSELPAPAMTVIVAAFNEERTIAHKVASVLASRYPSDKIELIVASDGSSDGTVQAAQRAGRGNIKVLDFTENHGRAFVQNRAATVAQGEILVFSDAETELAPDFLALMAKQFQNPQAGCGSGEYEFAAANAVGAAEGQYWSLERQLWRAEARLGILPFASGGCFAIRRSLFQPVPLHLDIDDFLMYHVLASGHSVFYASEAQARDVAVASTEAHYRKRVRTALKGMQGIFFALPELFRARKWAAIFVLLSHRVLRWLGGFLLALVLVANVSLWPRGGLVYRGCLLAQLAFYLAALAVAVLDWTGWAVPTRLARLPRLGFSFLVANAAFCRACFGCFFGERQFGYRPVSQTDV